MLIHLEEEIYKTAIDVLCKIQTCNKSLEAFPVHDKNVLLSGLDDFINYSGKYDSNFKNEFYQIWNKLLIKLPKPKYLALRDYHVDNLIWLSDRDKLRRIGLLDYQDASVSYLGYDVLSLIEDARRYVPYDNRTKYLQHFMTSSKLENETEFLQEYAILAAQRNMRIFGLFIKYGKAQGKEIYLQYLPNVKKYLLQDLKHPVLKQLKKLCEPILKDH